MFWELWDRRGGAVLLFDQDSGKLTVHTSKGLEGGSVTFKLTKSVVDWMVKTNLPFILSDLEDGKVKRFFERNKAKLKGVTAQVWTPLIAKETLLGVIVLGSKLGNKAYTRDDVSFLTTISGQAAQALENARSYQLIDAARMELDKKLYEQSTLYEVSRSLIGTLDLDVLLYQTLLMSIGIIGCRAGAIMLFDKVNGLLIVKNSKGLDENAVEGIELPLDEEFVGWLTEELGRPFLPSEAHDHPQLRDFLSKNRKAISVLNPTLFVPLVGKGGLVGMMTFAEKLLKGAYSEDDVKFT